MNTTNSNRSQRGMTLIELLIVVAIVALIAAVAFPSYTRYIVNAKRTTGTSALLQVADRQQQFFMDNKRFAADLTDLGFAADPYVVADDGQTTVAGDTAAVYSITLGNVTATTYTATAAPLHGQLDRDGDCGSLTLDQAGTKGQSGASDTCW